MKKRLLAIGLAVAALAAAPAFASSPPPTATAGPPLAATNDAKDVDSGLHFKGNTLPNLTAGYEMTGYSLHLRVTANDARSPLVARDLTADKTRPASESGMQALAQKNATEGTKKLLAASAGHPGIGIAWASAPAASTAKITTAMIAGEKYVMNDATIRASPSITLKV